MTNSIHVGAFDLPVSEFLSAESRSALQVWEQRQAQVRRECPLTGTTTDILLAQREYFAKKFFPSLIERYRAIFDVRIESRTIASVSTEIITSGRGAPPEAAEHVLINLHGGGFTFGAREGGQVESIPIAALGGTPVISVDYRMAPEYRFPAASEDVMAVYRELLKTYPAEKIGIFGCSAGAMLVTQTMAFLQKEDLPLPAAIGLFSSAGSFWAGGDSGHIGGAILGLPLGTSRENPYLASVDADDCLAFPARSDRVTARFPPSLLIAATRDFGLSSAAYMHSRLVALGVAAELHVWEGLGHGFFYEPDLAQSREAYDVIVRFFHRHLRKSRGQS